MRMAYCKTYESRVEIDKLVPINIPDDTPMTTLSHQRIESDQRLGDYRLILLDESPSLRTGRSHNDLGILMLLSLQTWIVAGPINLLLIISLEPSRRLGGQFPSIISIIERLAIEPSSLLISSVPMSTEWTLIFFMKALLSMSPVSTAFVIDWPLPRTMTSPTPLLRRVIQATKSFMIGFLPTRTMSGSSPTSSTQP